MNKGEISVLMAVYNCAGTVKESINSVLAQTYTNWKLIICDDCSTDGTYRIINEYAKIYPNKFIIIRNKQNSKLAFSLNHCLEYADGEFCARMDGDDYIAPERFEKQIEYLSTHSEIQLVGTWMQSFNTNGMGRIIQYKEYPETEDLRRGPCFAHASVMLYTYVYKELGGYTVSPRTARSQDYDLWFRFFAHRYKGANIQEVLYFVREDTYSFSRRKPQLYLWATVTRWKGFRMVNMSLKYYPWVLLPIPSMVGNELRKMQARIKNKKSEE